MTVVQTAEVGRRTQFQDERSRSLLIRGSTEMTLPLPNRMVWRPIPPPTSSKTGIASLSRVRKTKDARLAPAARSTLNHQNEALQVWIRPWMIVAVTEVLPWPRNALKWPVAVMTL
jgi:hypothetical protein